MRAMATRTIGDIQKTNGNASIEDSLLIENAEVRSSGELANNNELNELGQKIFLDRYAMKDMKKRTLGVGDLVIVCVKVELKDGTTVERLTEHISKPIETSPEQMMERVARGIAALEGPNADEWYGKFRWLLNGWKFVPAGRILAAAGTDQQLTFYNCYVVPSPKDSRKGIVDTLSQMMEIMSRGGGVGINVSSLRPRHSYVKGVNGRSSGSVSWGALYSFVTGLIEQGGSRRGALMLILNCWHPDIMEFINAKRDMGKINNANVSVGVTDKFMDAVHADADWDLLFADPSDPDFERMWDGNLDKWLAAGKQTITYQTVKARDIWNAIIESAWSSAEPGVFFIERANKDSNSWYYDAGYLGCTNPCVTGDTLVSTPEGWKRADSVFEGDTIATVLGRGEVETVERHASVPVFRVTLSDGATLRVTAAHKFHAIISEARAEGKNANKHFTPIRLDHLKVGDYIRIAPALMPDNEVPGKPATWLDREYGFLLGLLLGDGCYTENKLARNTVMISCDARETQWADIVSSMMMRAGAPVVNRYQNRDSKGRLTNSLSLAAQAQHGFAEFVSTTLLEPATSVEKDIPLEYINTNREFLAGLLDGLWSTDGNVNLKSSHPLLRFKTSSEKLAQSVRRILLMFGVHGRIVKGVRGHNEIDGRQINNSRPYYEILISGAGVKTFAEQIGITHPDKAEKLKKAQLEFALTGNTWLARIKAIEAAGEEAVYDLYEPESDTWITDGIVNQGCGEQPLPGFGVCNLGAINLSKFVRDGEVEWDDLGKAVRYSVRFLDNVIDATPYFFEENYDQQKSERRVGLNTMGLAEMLIRLGIRYGSDESVQFIDKLYRFISSNSYEASADIAAEKGPFPMFDADKFLQSGYMQRMPEDVRQSVREKGVRNVTLLTQAPNGTIGTMVGTSTGIEPFYFWSYYRKSRLGKHEERVKVLEEWQQANQGETMPDYFVTAMDLAPEEHVKVQAAIQRWVDSSISKTCNLPNSYTVDQTREVYELLYKSGCKGGTIYRDGSRDVQVLNLKEDDKKTSDKPVEAPTAAPVAAAPEAASAAVESKAIAPVESSSPVEKATPVESPVKPKIRPRPYKRRGYTVSKNTPSGTAHITMNEDEESQPFEVFLEIGKAGSDIKAMAEAMGRLMSLVLRIESPISPVERVQEIVKQITGIGGARSYGYGKRRVLSLPDAVGQALAENYLGVPMGTEDAGQGAVMGVEGVELGSALSAETKAKLSGKAVSEMSADLCPNCGDSAFIRIEGCHSCYACGYSEC
jgi:ribonucleoside-diphosphate reductase alpha chain